MNRGDRIPDLVTGGNQGSPTFYPGVTALSDEVFERIEQGDPNAIRTLHYMAAASERGERPIDITQERPGLFRRFMTAIGYSTAV